MSDELFYMCVTKLQKAEIDYLCSINSNNMAQASPRYPVKRPSFQSELKKRVENYFEENKLKTTGNLRLYAKTVILAVSFIGIYISLVFFTPNIFIALLESALLGIGVALIGFNIMHDGAHGSYSSSNTVNKMMAKSLDFLGGSSFMWKFKHNMIHHTYTNIDGMDEDIEIRPFLRVTPTQKRYWFHRFQHLYCLFLYGMVHVSWITGMDLKKYFTQRIGHYKIKEMTWRDHVSFWFSKVMFITLYVVLPIYFIGFWPYLLGFAIFSFSAGVTLGTVFQLAHTVEHLDFPVVNQDDPMMEDEWAAMQVKTTANFATKNPIVTWATGGLNFQIEHHLFPKISHVHYPALSKIVKETCKDFQIKYTEFPRMTTALISHLKWLRQLGMA